MIATDVSVWLDALAGSHDRLCDLVSGLDDAALAGPSYCADWTIAQVLAHLGSGAEILATTVDAVLAREAPPRRDTYPGIWARWNALTPSGARDRALSTDGTFVEKLEHLGDALDDLEFTLFERLHVDAVGLLRVRLSEHALHTWDVAVALDSRALVDPDAVALLCDGLQLVVARLGKPDRSRAAPYSVCVVTSDPERRLRLDVGDDVALVPGDETTACPALHLTAEAFLRLTYGRLDPAHAPAPRDGERPLLDGLRTVFPGI